MTARRDSGWALAFQISAAVAILIGVVRCGVVYDSPSERLTEPAAPIGEYDRDAFGRAWVDVDGDGCNQRDQVLQRDLTEIVLAENGCTVLRGWLVDPYTGVRIEHVRGEPSKVQIDHIYSLRDAWDDGAAGWADSKRLHFANDLRNLVASSGSVNRSKSSLGPAEWYDSIVVEKAMCPYLLSYSTVAFEYGLELDPASAGFLDGATGESCFGKLLTD